MGEASNHPTHQATQTNREDEGYINPQNDMHLNGTLQGATRETYWINEVYRPRNTKDYRPRTKPIPDPAKEKGRKRKSLFDATIICNACHMVGHPACRCHSLAAAVWIFKFLEDKTNEEDCKQALEHWEKRNQNLLRDPKTNRLCNTPPLQVLRTYAERYGHSIDTIDDNIDWQCFECDHDNPNELQTVFGLDWPATTQQSK